MGYLFLLIGTIGGALLGIAALGFFEVKTSSGIITTSAWLIGSGIIFCTLLTLAGSKISDDEAEQVSTTRHQATLLTVAREARRIDPASIRVVITFDLEDVGSSGSTLTGPNFLSGTWDVQLRVKPAASYQGEQRDLAELARYVGTAEIFVADRSIGQTKGTIVGAVDGMQDFDYAILKFPIIRTKTDLFPRLEASEAGVPPSRFLMISGGIMAMAILFIVALIWIYITTAMTSA